VLRYAHAAWLGHRLYPGSNVYRMAEHVAVTTMNLSDMQSDPEPTVKRSLVQEISQGTLHKNGVVDGARYPVKQDQDPVAGRLNELCAEFLAMGLEELETERNEIQSSKFIG